MDRCFASDNYSGVHPKIMEAITKANQKHAKAYGDDEYTASAVKKVKEHFGADVDVHFVFNGTAANVLSLKTVSHSFNSVICAESAHINVDECGAPENITGSKLIDIPTPDGKITVEQVRKHLFGFDDQHHAQPRVISITQPTELGTLYTNEEVKALADLAHQHNMILHMDGARLSNAAAALNQSFKETTFDQGVDVLSFGGTKNGMMFGEAVVFKNDQLSKNFKFIRKQNMQLLSKMRFISSQFEALLTDNLWLENAKHSNRMASLLAEEVSKIPSVKITQKVEVNGVFAIMPKEHISALQEEFPFYVWDEDLSEVRWMCSFDTTEDDIQRFVSALKEHLS